MDNDDQRYDEALREAAGFVDQPPAQDSPEGRRFDALLEMILGRPEAAAPAPHDAASHALRTHLAEVARTRAVADDHRFLKPDTDGLGPTLGMDVSHS